MRALLALLACLWVLPALAQEDDRGLIVGFLEDQLSGAGRDIRLTGFTGALSSRATLEELTIADDDGVWLILRGVVLDWNRAALLRGALDVTELTAQELILPRLPAADATAAAPTAEATGFRIPELPFSVSIDTLAIGSAQIGAPVLGQAVTASLEGGVQLVEGTSAARLVLQRIDGQTGRIAVDAALTTADNSLRLDLRAQEAQGGIMVSLLDLPGQPSLDLAVTGNAPLSAFRADIRLATDGAPRLSGAVTLSQEAGSTEFDADIAGDVTALFAPQYRDFFGPNVALKAAGGQAANGTMTLRALDLSAAALSLQGSAMLDAAGNPLALDLRGQLADPSGGPVLLPGSDITVGGGTLSATFDASIGPDWAIAITARSVTQPGTAQIAALDLTLDGSLTPPGQPLAVDADITLAATGLALEDPALATAVGTAVQTRARVAWQTGGPLALSDLTLSGAGYALGVMGDVQLVERQVQVQGSVTGQISNLARFSDLAGLPLTGAVNGTLSGNGDPLGGVFDATLALSGSGLSTGIAQLDPILAPGVTLSGGAARGPQGLVLRDLNVTSRDLTALLSGRVATDNSDLTLTARLSDLALVLPDVSGPVSVTGTARDKGQGWELALDTQAPESVTGQVAGTYRPGTSTFAIDLSVPRIAAFVPDIPGGAQVTGTVAETARAGVYAVDLAGKGPYEVAFTAKGSAAATDSALDITLSLPDVAPLAPGLSGPVVIAGAIADLGAGRLAVDLTGTGPFDVTAIAKGTLAATGSRLTIDASLPDVAPLAPGYRGALAVRGTVADAGAGMFDVDLTADGPYGLTTVTQGRVGATGSRLNIDASLPDVAPLAPGYRGPLAVRGTVADAGAGNFDVDLSANGPYGLTAQTAGNVGADTRLSLEARLPDVAPFTPGYRGALAVRGTVADAGAGNFDVLLEANGPYGLSARTNGLVGAALDLNLSAQLPDIAPLVPGLSGAVSAQGSVTQQSGQYAIDIATQGPGSSVANILGTVTQDASRAALGITGTVPLALANRMLAPRAVLGMARFDLRLDGLPSLSSLSGSVQVDNARLSLPTLQKALDDINATVQLNAGAAQITAQSGFSDGGTLRVTGPVQLTGTPSADLTIALEQIRLNEPSLYETTLDGQIGFSGPLAGGAQITGALTLGQTNIQIPESGLSFGATIPDITHLNVPGAVLASQLRAGIGATSGGAAKAAASGPAYGLDVSISAPARIFIRGRGLDAELGGSLRLSGTTAAVVPIGQFDLIRGRIDVLTKRLTLDEGRITLAGDFVPQLYLSARAISGDITAITTLSGQLSDPTIAFTSEPELPQDEVLARLFFGKGIASLSPLQALQMANAARTLAGKGGSGVINKLRENFKLDDLDVSTDASGATAVRAGAYISENVYSDVTTNSKGDAEVNLKIDLSDSFTLKGSADNSGDTSIGIFFERDY